MSDDTAMPAAFRAHDHAACVAQGLERAEALARAQGLRLTPVRRRVLEILLERHGAMGAYEVLDRLAQDGYGHQPPVAYRALDFLVEHGMAHRIRRINAFIACAHPGEDHHAAFLICRHCKTVGEIPADALREALEASAGAVGFGIERVSLEASGLCARCRSEAGSGPRE